MGILKSLLHFESNVITGIDIGSFSTKVISVKCGNGTKEIVFAKEFPVMQYERPDALLERVSEELSLNNVTKKSVFVVSVPLANYSYFFLNIPKIPDDEIIAAVEWELKKHLTSPVEEFSVDYVTVREFADEGMQKYEVFVVAAPRSEVMKFLNMFKGKRLKIKSITVNPVALVSLVNMLLPSEKEDTIIIGDIGYLRTEMVIVKNGILRFARVVKIGISQIVSNLNQNFGIPPEKSISILKQYGFNPVAAIAHNEAFKTVLKEAAGKFALEFQRFTDYFSAAYPGEICNKIYLTGGGSVIPGIQDIIQPFFDLKVDIFEPSPNLSVFNKSFAEELNAVFSTAAGLALSEARF